MRLFSGLLVINDIVVDVGSCLSAAAHYGI